MKTTEIKERAKKGAAYLDTKYADWYNTVKVGKLAMLSACTCVLGLLHNVVSDDKIEEAEDFAISPYTRMTNILGLTDRECIELGFIISDNYLETRSKEAVEDVYDDLTAAWLGEIYQRQQRKTGDNE